MPGLTREFIRAMKTRQGRFRLRYALVRNIPGEYGFILRRRVLRQFWAVEPEEVRVHEGFRFRNIERITLGKRVNVGVDSFIQAGGGVDIGDFTILGPGVRIWTQNHVSSDPTVPIQDQGAEYKPVKIGRDVWIGANAFVMPGAELGDGVVVAACAVVGAKKYPPYKILAGNPARVIGTREPAAEPKTEEKSAEDNG